ncbi:dCTP deaminase [Candidatus Woesearchaeota archaeon]|nr:dCTP deaminase [Candidatus Woesearchaeota archaeon]
MAVLTRTELLKEIKKGRIKITDFDEKYLGPASYDLRLDDKFRVFRKDVKKFDVTEQADHKKITKLVTVETIVVKPGEIIHGITKETITLPEDICGRLEGRSRFARLGLLVHVTAGFMQPGISNQQVLEIINLSPIPLTLHAGTRICQFVFERCEGEAKYQGKFSSQKAP